MMKYSIITLFPELIHSYCSTSIIGRAQGNNIIAIETINPRDFTHDVHRSVDDTPYGGGSGMVLKCDPIYAAVESIERTDKSVLILSSPQGKPLKQALVENLVSDYDHIVVICGHYEGFDERIREGLNPLEISAGDFILTGGELLALCLIDTTSRLISGVLGKDESLIEESFSNGLLEYPHYTRPPEFRGMKVPDVLLSGHHKKISLWRRQQSLVRTLKRRPDLLEVAELSVEDKKFIADYKNSIDKE